VLRRLRRARRWSLGQTAEQLGVTRQFLSSVERGIRPLPPEHWSELARHLAVGAGPGPAREVVWCLHAAGADVPLAAPDGAAPAFRDALLAAATADWLTAMAVDVEIVPYTARAAADGGRMPYVVDWHGDAERRIGQLCALLPRTLNV
jgi:hypothetical protein